MPRSCMEQTGCSTECRGSRAIGGAGGKGCRARGVDGLGTTYGCFGTDAAGGGDQAGDQAAMQGDDQNTTAGRCSNCFASSDQLLLTLLSTQKTCHSAHIALLAQNRIKLTPYNPDCSSSTHSWGGHSVCRVSKLMCCSKAAQAAYRRRHRAAGIP